MDERTYDEHCFTFLKLEVCILRSNAGHITILWEGSHTSLTLCSDILMSEQDLMGIVWPVVTL